jgi:hypothetical protein
LTCSGDNVVQIWDLIPDERPLADLQALAELLAHRRIDGSGALVETSPAAWQRAQNELRQKYPTQFKPPPSSVDSSPLPQYLASLDTMLTQTRYYDFEDLARRELLSGNGPEAVAAAQRSIRIYPEGNRGLRFLAHGYILCGRFEEATAIYRSNASAFAGNQLWLEAALEDLLEFERRGHQDLSKGKEILEALLVTTRAATRPATHPASGASGATNPTAP